VESLVSSVLLGMAGQDALGVDAELDPPRMQAGEPVDRLRGEGRAVISADHVGQAVLSEGAFKQGPD